MQPPFSWLTPRIVARAVAWITVGLIVTVVLMFSCTAANREFSRYQKRAEAQNNARVARLDLIRYDALVEQEERKAEVRVAEANGIAQSQAIIDASLTTNYLRYLSIQAQMEMALNENSTVIYIPTENGSVPLVRDTSEDE